MTVGTPGAGSSAQTDRFVHQRLPGAAACAMLRYDLPEMRMPGVANLVEMLFERIAARNQLERPFLRGDASAISYGRAWQQVRKIGQVLTEDFGLVPGNRVLLRGGNSDAMALAWLGAVRAGLVAVATMPLLRARELADIYAKAQPALAVCDAALTGALVDGALAAGSNARTVVFHAAGDGHALEALAAAKSGQGAACATSADDIALMAFTSGTTGRPKAAVHSHGDVLAACEAWPRHVLCAEADDIVLGSPPLAFTFGLGGLLVFPMWAGASVYFPPAPYSPESMVDAFSRCNATICYTAPTFYRQMAPFAKLRGVGRLRRCVSAGEALPDTTRALWKDASGIELIDGIGATEMFHIFLSTVPGQHRAGSLGKVVPGYTARVVDEQGYEVAHGTAGKLAIIGPTACRYLDDARQSHYVRRGWNYPGDAFRQDGDGYFYYCGRDDDMIITAGYNVAGPEVESALLQHPWVLDAAVVGMPDVERGMVVKAFVVLRSDALPGNEAIAVQLQDHVKAVLAPFKYPRQIAFVSALPRTETGKLQRYKLRGLGASTDRQESM
jgi:2-aminobenzoate-CoA ligase